MTDGMHRANHERVAVMARSEADSGATARMVATYVKVALRHLDAGHDGEWRHCSPCHEGLHA